MKNVIVRSITGLLYVAAIVGAVIAGGWWLWLLVVVFGVLAVGEFNRIANNHFVSNTTIFLDMIGAVLLLTASTIAMYEPKTHIESEFFSPFDIQLVCFMGYMAYMIIRFIVQLYVQDGNPLSRLAHSIMAQVYIVWPLAMLEMMYGLMGWEITLCMFILIWLSDTGAFCVGSLFGRHKLFERISPKKSWEGFFGGVAFCVVAAVVMSNITGTDEYTNTLSVWQWVGFGLIVSMFATWGDLVESMIKRAIGVKDSGNILPGHGGILDRIDSLLLVAPVSLFYLCMMKL